MREKSILLCFRIFRNQLSGGDGQLGGDLLLLSGCEQCWVQRPVVWPVEDVQDPGSPSVGKGPRQIPPHLESLE